MGCSEGEPLAGVLWTERPSLSLVSGLRLEEVSTTLDP